MNENLILIAENKIEDQSLLSQEARKQIKKLEEDYPQLLQWCFFNLHKLTANESRIFVLSKIQNIIDFKFNIISINSRDELLLEFFFKIFNDTNYLNTDLLNLISGIQTRLIKRLFPFDWPTAFDSEDEISIVNSPDSIFYNFLISFSQVAKNNKKIVNDMIEDDFSLKNVVNRISESTIQGSSDAKKAYLNCFKWIDFHFLITYPCIGLILDDFKLLPNPETAITILSTIFKQDKIDSDERIKLITDFNLMEKFTKYLKTFTVVKIDHFNNFVNLICNIFLPLQDNEFSSTFFPVFTTAFTRLLTMKCKDANFRLNDLFNGMITNEVIEYQSLKEIYYPMLINTLENPKDDFDLNLSLLFDLFFRSIYDKKVLIDETKGFLTELMETVKKTPDEHSKCKYFYYILNEFLIFVQRRRSKAIMYVVLEFFAFLLESKPTKEILEDEYYVKSMKSYTGIYVLSSLYSDSKLFEEIKNRANILFDILYQCTILGTDAFFDSMYSLAKSFPRIIILLSNINDIMISFISSLNVSLFKIAKQLLVLAPFEVVGMIKKKATEMIIERDPASITSSDVKALLLIFNKNEEENKNEFETDSKTEIELGIETENEDETETEAETEDEKQSNNFSGFIFVSPKNTNAFDFFAQIFILNAKQKETGEEEDSSDRKFIFESREDFFEYIKMLIFLFGYKAFPFYSNEIFAVPENHDISVITSIATILSTKFNNIDPEKITPEIEETTNFLIEYAQNSTKILFDIIERDSKEANEEPSKEMKDFYLFYSEFTRYIVPFIPIAPREIFLQILSVFENIFKYPLLSSEAYKIFFRYIIKNNDISLVKDVYPNSVYLLVQMLSQPSIYASDFKKCAIEIFIFHHKMFNKDREVGSSIIAPAADVLSKVEMKFFEYNNLMESDKDQFPTLLGKIINHYFKKKTII